MSLTITYPENLPVSARREDIMAAISAHPVVVVAGETGSGKTTQIPKMCLELQRKGLLFKNSVRGTPPGKKRRGIIGHTQPRRIAARSVAERIAHELGVPLGDEVGYQVRFEKTVAADTRVKVMTDGVLLSEVDKDPLLRRYDVIIVDEAHERSLNIDFLLGYLKKLLHKREDLKVIITSATIDTDKFRKHFSSPAHQVPVVEVSGRSYPVEVRYAPMDNDNYQDEEGRDDGKPHPSPKTARGTGSLSRKLSQSEDVKALSDAIIGNVGSLLAETSGDILVFLAGEHDIRDIQDSLTAHFIRYPRNKGGRKGEGNPQVLPLFGRLSLAEQHRVFSPDPGTRRVILSTNVAETSLTVPNITAVIDTGLARISRYSPRTKVQRLPIEPISQASANQRAGRCGRVSAGVCVRLYSEEDFAARPEFTDPEIMRSNLAGVILRMSALGLADDVQHLMSFDFVDPPNPRAISDGIVLLQEIGALDRYRLTQVGRSLSALPLDPRLARMLLESKKHGAETEALVIAAALTVQDPRERPLEKQDSADSLHRRFADRLSDFSTLLNLWRYVSEQQAQLSSSAFRKLCRSEFLNFLGLRQWQDLYEQLRRMAEPLGIKAPSIKELRRNAAGIDPVAAYEGLHKSIIAGFLSHIGLKNEKSRGQRSSFSAASTNNNAQHASDYLGIHNSHFNIFPGSAVFSTKPEWIVAAELVETSKLWGRMVAKVEADWIEEVASEQRHLLKRSYSEPHWSKKSGAVLAYEKVTLYGLPIVPRRQVNYGNIDQVVSHDLLIRHALVEGQWYPHHRFWRHNQKMLQEVEALEERTAQRGLRVDDQVLYEFYAARVPENIVSTRHFDKWWKHEQHRDPHLLDFTSELLSTRAADAINVSDFPRSWTLHNYPGERQPQVELRYSYNHGVTARIPIALLRDVDGSQFRWQVPGYRLELITALIKAMPKTVRKNFVPAPDTARRAAEILSGNYKVSDNFQQALSDVLQQLKGHPVPEDSWQWDSVEPRLTMSFEVVDGRGKGLKPPNQVNPKDLESFKQALADQMRQALVASMGVKPAAPPPGHAAPSTAQKTLASGVKQEHDHGPGSIAAGFREHTGLTSWDSARIGTLIPEEVTSDISELTGYPALTDENGMVAVRLFPYKDAAQYAHRLGVLRLLYLRITETDQGITHYLGNHLNMAEKLACAHSPYASSNNAAGKALLLDDIIYAAVSRLAMDTPRSDKGFEALFQQVRADVVEESFQVIALFTTISALADKTRQLLSSNAVSLAGQDAVNDMSDQLSHLVYPGFIVDTPAQYLHRLPLYLEAIQTRYGKLSLNFDYDYSAMRQIQELEDEFDSIESAHQARGYGRTAQLEHARWMLEEFRLSLFAQGQGTLYKVSAKRIRTVFKQTMSH